MIAEGADLSGVTEGGPRFPTCEQDAKALANHTWEPVVAKHQAQSRLTISIFELISLPRIHCFAAGHDMTSVARPGETESPYAKAVKGRRGNPVFR